MSSASLSIESNVNIKVRNQYGVVVRDSSIHNKATNTMVEGLVRFLQGEFNRSHFNNQEAYVTNNEADKYIPGYIKFGNVGVKMKDRSTSIPKLKAIEYSQMKKPTFDDIALQDKIKFDYPGVGNMELLKLTTSTVTTFDDPNSSMGLLLQLFIPTGDMVGFGSGEDRQYYIDNVVNEIIGEGSSSSDTGNGWVYYDFDKGEYATIFTEMGLYSGQGALLARVLFDDPVIIDEATGTVVYENKNSPNNPIIQTDSSSIVIEWRIGITSIGQNDRVITQSLVPTPNTSGSLNNGGNE